MRVFKKILLYFTGFLGLLLLLIVLLPFLFKGKIINLTKEYLNKNIVNARVDVKDIDLSIFSSFPDFRLEIKGLHIQNDSTFQDLDLLNVGRIAIDLDLMSVIKGEKYQVNLIGLENLNANALLLADGRANYDIFAKSDSTKKEEKTEASSDKAFSLQLKKLKIRHANLSYEDKKSGSKYSTEDLNFSLSGDLGQEHSLLKLILKVAKTNALVGGVKYANNTKLEFKAELDADLKNQKYQFKENSLKLNAFMLKFDGFIRLLSKAYDLDLNIVAPKVSLKDVLSLVPSLYTKDYKDMIAQGKISFEAFAKGIYDSTRIPAFKLNFNVDNGSFKYPSLPQTVKDIDAHLIVDNTDGVLDNTKVLLRSLHISFAENPVDASMSLTKPISDPNIDLKVQGHLDLSKLKEFVPAESLKNLTGKMDADIQVAGTKSLLTSKQYNKLKAQGLFVIKDLQYLDKALHAPAQVRELALEFTPAKVALKNLDAKLGNSDLRLNGVIANFLEYMFGTNQELIGTFQLHSNKLDLNEFMQSKGAETTPKTAEVNKETPKNDSAKLANSSKVLAIPARINASLSTDIKNILFDQWDIQNFKGKVALHDQSVSLQNIIFSLIGASFMLNGTYSTKDIRKPKVSLASNIRNLDIQRSLQAFPSVKKMASIVKECHGIVACNVNFNTLFSDSMTPILSTLNANGKISAKSVRLDGELTNGLLGLVEKLNLPEPALRDLDLDFQIHNGTLGIKPFDMRLGPINGLCSANYNLAGNMDMSYKAKVPTALMQNLLQEGLSDISQALNKAKEYGLDNIVPENWGVIIGANGPANKPKYTLKIDPAFSASIKKNLEQAVSKKLNQMKTKVLNEAKKKAEAEINKQKEKLKKKVEEEKNKLIEEGKKKLQNLLGF